MSKFDGQSYASEGKWAVIQVDRKTAGYHTLTVYGEKLTLTQATQLSRKVNGEVVSMIKLDEMQAFIASLPDSQNNQTV